MAVINLRDGIASTSSQDEVTIINNNVGALAINDLTDVDTTGVADNKILKYDGTANKFVVADDTNTGINNLVEDTSPQLGGTLDSNGEVIIMLDSTAHANNQIHFGVSQRMSMYHDGTTNHIRSENDLQIRREGDDHNATIGLWKDVESGGDLSRRVGTYSAITDGTTTKYLGINNWSDDATNGKQYNIGYLSDDGATTNLVLQATENSGLIVKDDVDMQVNNINEISSLNLNNSHGASRDTEIRSTTSGAGGLVLTTIGSGQNGRPSRIFLQQKNGGGTELGGVEQRFTYHSTEANKKYDVRVYSDDYSSNTVAYEVNGLGDTTKLRSDTVRLQKADSTDMLVVKDNSSAAGGLDAQLYGEVSVQPEVSTETDLSIMNLKPDYGSNSIPDGADVKLNFQVRNDADGSVTLGKFSATYDSTAADRKFRMESADGSNAMEFFNSKTAMEGPVRFQRLSTTEINALSPEAGWVVYNNTTNKLVCYNGTSWNDLF